MSRQSLPRYYYVSRVPSLRGMPPYRYANLIDNSTVPASSRPHNLDSNTDNAAHPTIFQLTISCCVSYLAFMTKTTDFIFVGIKQTNLHELQFVERCLPALTIIIVS